MAAANRRHFYHIPLIPMFFTIDHYGTKQVRIVTDRYSSGQLYVELGLAHEPYTTLSLHLPGVTIGLDEFIFKTYAENEGLFDQLLALSVIECVRIEQHALGRLPICRLTSA